VNYILCANPSFKEKYFPDGLTIEALKKAPGAVFDQRVTMHYGYIEQHYGLKAGEYPCHTVRSSEAFVIMAIEGVAYCLLPHIQANEYLTSGVLIDLAPKQHLPQMLYWHSWLFEKGLHQEISQTVIENGKAFLSLTR
jgi:LysR family transcriptional regulator (chromosome initiation inhibitor)